MAAAFGGSAPDHVPSAIEPGVIYLLNKLRRQQTYTDMYTNKHELNANSCLCTHPCRLSLSLASKRLAGPFKPNGSRAAAHREKRFTIFVVVLPAMIKCWLKSRFAQSPRGRWLSRLGVGRAREITVIHHEKWYRAQVMGCAAMSRLTAQLPKQHIIQVRRCVKCSEVFFSLFCRGILAICARFSIVRNEVFCAVAGTDIWCLGSCCRISEYCFCSMCCVWVLECLFGVYTF